MLDLFERNFMKKICKDIGLLFLTIILFFSIAELIIRTCYKLVTKIQEIKVGQDSPYQLSKNKKIAYEEKHNDPVNETHDYDFRNQLFSISPNNNTFRIIVIGDSVCWGASIKENDKIFSKIIENILNNKSASKKFEVLNFCVGAYNTEQEKILLEEELLKYKPRMVILQFLSNDVWESKTINNNSLVPVEQGYAVEFFDSQPVPISLPLPVQINKFLLERSYFFRFVSIRYYYFLNAMKITFDKEFYLSGYEKSKMALKEIKELTDKNNVELLIVLSPSFGEKQDFFYAWFVNTTKELGLNMLDVYETALKNYDYGDVSLKDLKVYPFEVYTYSTHLNALGHQIVAEEIYKKLINDDLIN